MKENGMERMHDPTERYNKNPGFKIQDRTPRPSQGYSVQGADQH